MDDATAVAGALLRALDPVETFEAAVGPADPWQIDLLRSTSRRVLVNVARQLGKSVVAATLAVHRAVYAPGSLVLVLSPGERQSAELLRKARDVFAALGQPVREIAESVTKLELENGSRVLALPGTERTVRGLSAVDLLIVDEASRVEDALYQAVRPMLAVSGGRLLALSTPWGRRGWWADAWHSTEPWERVRVTAHDCPRITPAFLEEERRSLPGWVFEQEYLCIFAEAAGAVFREEDLQAAFDPNLKPLFPPGDEIWRHVTSS